MLSPLGRPPKVTPGPWLICYCPFCVDSSSLRPYNFPKTFSASIVCCMTSVSVLFYGRRTRLGRSTSDPDYLGFLSSSSSSDRSHDTNPSHRHRSNSRKAGGTRACGRSDRRRLHPRSDQHNRRLLHVTPGEFDESGTSSCYLRQPCSEATAPDIVPIQQFEGGVTEAPIQNIFHGDTLDSIRVRFNSNERLPRSVLLARDRLVQRLRGVSVSSVRQSLENDPGTHFDNYWLNDSGNWQTSNLEENRFITDLTSPAPRQLHEAISDPQELEREALASLHHEVFTNVVDVDSNHKFSVSDECSICLERFAEGDELVSLQCGHRFHSSCLCPWVQTCRKCPYCRTEISSH